MCEDNSRCPHCGRHDAHIWRAENGSLWGTCSYCGTARPLPSSVNKLVGANTIPRTPRQERLIA